MSEKIAEFRALHVPGDPLILINIWDAGSAKAVAAAGAKAFALGRSPYVFVTSRPEPPTRLSSDDIVEIYALRRRTWSDGMPLRLILTGHTDVRGSHPYNTELGLRRAQAVQRAIAAYLPRGMSEAVKVEHNEDPAAPAEHGR